jgi:hypothetical protein
VRCVKRNWSLTLLSLHLVAAFVTAGGLAAAFFGSVAFAAPQSGEKQLDAAGAPLTVDEIVRNLTQRNQERALALRRFEGTRIYRLHYQGFFGTHNAQMTVSVESSLDDRQFTVESQSGSKFIIDHIFKRLLKSEKEASVEQRDRTALTTRNYAFTLAGVDSSSGSPMYVLNVIPKTDEKYLYRGKVWVDGKDFAVVRIEAEPAKNPSMWIKTTAINHQYEKVADFWLPAENRTDSSMRFGGHALLSIEYKDYKITEAQPVVSKMSTSGSLP